MLHFLFILMLRMIETNAWSSNYNSYLIIIPWLPKSLQAYNRHYHGELAMECRRPDRMQAPAGKRASLKAPAQPLLTARPRVGLLTARPRVGRLVSGSFLLEMINWLRGSSRRVLALLSTPV